MRGRKGGGHTTASLNFKKDLEVTSADEDKGFQEGPFGHRASCPFALPGTLLGSWTASELLSLLVWPRPHCFS